MTAWLCSAASRTRAAVVLNERAHVRPCIVASNDFDCLVFSEVTGEWVVVFVLEYSKPKVVMIWDVDSVVE